MLKAIAALLFLASACVGQSSADGFFVVRNIKQSDDILTPVQMREAERLYLNACAVVRHDFDNRRIERRGAAGFDRVLESG